jgi:hypothetical protein
MGVMPPGLRRSRVFRTVTLELPRFLLTAIETLRELANREKRLDPPMTLDQYLTWWFTETLGDDLRDIADAVPGVRLAAQEYAQWQARELGLTQAAKRRLIAKQPTKLARYMKERGIPRRLIWESGLISRRALSDLMTGKQLPNLRTMISLAREIRRLEDSSVEIADLFDLTVE